jgi:glutamate synthase (NADPH/NADH) small chain
MESKTIFGADPRVYSVVTKEFKDDGHGNVKSLVIQEVSRDARTGQFIPVPNSEKEIPADLVVLAMGFQSPEKALLEQLNIKVDPKRNAIDASSATNYHTNQMSIFAAGDCRRGQSLVVWAIHEGRDVAQKCANYLTEKRQAAHNFFEK